MDKKLEKLSKQPFTVEAARKYLESRKDFKKLFNVEYKGTNRQTRLDKSPISEYRWIIEICLEYAIPLNILQKSIQQFDPRLKDYKMITLRMYCSRMFKKTPIENKTEDRIFAS